MSTPQDTSEAIAWHVNGDPVYSLDSIETLYDNIVDLARRQFPGKE